MNLDRVLSEIDLEISRLQQAKQLLSENAGAAPVKRGPGRPPASAKPLTKPVATATEPKKRTMSAAGRARIAAAQKARWAKSKKAAKKASAPSAKKAASKKTVKKATGKKVGRPAGKKAASQVETAATPAS